ncbi:hemerythrin HHE cation binding domain-containing protein [Xylariomycetidae sp. FL0641]|nr:hemerythrin HHE cation binding domain-containing protein [Xylariomycetidae sp. FL0641]
MQTTKLLPLRSAVRSSITTRAQLIPFTLRRSFQSTPAAMGKLADAITHDHRELEDYYEKMVKTTDPDERERWQNQFVWELARHSLSEEIVVYPLMEKNLPQGLEMADKDRADHRIVKSQLKIFQKLKASDPDFMPTLHKLMSDLKEHIKEEEKDDLPALERTLSDSDQEGTASSFERTKMLVPTRSHPSTPEKPPFETAVGLMMAPIDKVMDVFRKFPQK